MIWECFVSCVKNISTSAVSFFFGKTSRNFQCLSHLLLIHSILRWYDCTITNYGCTYIWLHAVTFKLYLHAGKTANYYYSSPTSANMWSSRVYHLYFIVSLHFFYGYLLKSNNFSYHEIVVQLFNGISLYTSYINIYKSNKKNLNIVIIYLKVNILPFPPPYALYVPVYSWHQNILFLHALWLWMAKNIQSAWSLKNKLLSILTPTVSSIFAII